MTDYIQKALEADSAWLDIESAEEGTRVLQKNSHLINVGRISKNAPDAYKAQSYAPLNAPDLLFAEVKRLRAQLDIAVKHLNGIVDEIECNGSDELRIAKHGLKQIGDL